MFVASLRLNLSVVSLTTDCVVEDNMDEHLRMVREKSFGLKAGNPASNVKPRVPDTLTALALSARQSSQSVLKSMLINVLTVL